MLLWAKTVERNMSEKPRLEDITGTEFITTKQTSNFENIKIFTVDSLEDCLEMIFELNNDEKIIPIYRGQSSDSFRLIPKIGRQQLRSSCVENNIFLDFKRNYRRYYNQMLTSNMDILMLGQHYGLPTRLLDWTTNPLVGVYFACASQPDNDGVIFVKGLKKDEKYVDEKDEKDPFSYTENIFIFPENFEIRFANQNGLFELFANPTVESNSDLKAKIIIKANAKDQIIRRLSLLNIEPTDLFPNLDNLCRHIESEYLV